MPARRIRLQFEPANHLSFVLCELCAHCPVCSDQCRRGSAHETPGRLEQRGPGGGRDGCRNWDGAGPGSTLLHHWRGDWSWEEQWGPSGAWSQFWNSNCFTTIPKHTPKDPRAQQRQETVLTGPGRTHTVLAGNGWMDWWTDYWWLNAFMNIMIWFDRRINK